ncbi:MAG: hypothetical protein PHT33_10290 [bacterium]|nr:hypothetical protein [bacterium]
MAARFFRLICIIVGSISGYYVGKFYSKTHPVNFTVDMLNFLGLMAVMAMMSYIVAPVLYRILNSINRSIGETVRSLSPRTVALGAVGLIIGLVISNLTILPLVIITKSGIFLLVLSCAILGYLGAVIAVSLGQSRLNNPLFDSVSNNDGGIKLLDTSVIIDGRIADLAKTGFVEGTILIPRFVLEELHHISDSADALRRNRGRRGLDVLNRLQKELETAVEVYETDIEGDEVDAKLVKLGKLMGAKVITNDYNLNKVAEFEGVQVLNINELANAVKPVVLPGEDIVVTLIKEGKDPDQAIGYLDDGTMIVVEDGKRLIGETIPVEVTSTLQTAAGKMIFARPRERTDLEVTVFDNSSGNSRSRFRKKNGRNG